MLSAIMSARLFFLRRFFKGSLDSGRIFFPRASVTFRVDTGAAFAGVRVAAEDLRADGMSRIERGTDDDREALGFTGGEDLGALGAMSQDFFADIRDECFRDTDSAVL